MLALGFAERLIGAAQHVIELETRVPDIPQASGSLFLEAPSQQFANTAWSLSRQGVPDRIRVHEVGDDIRHRLAAESRSLPSASRTARSRTPRCRRACRRSCRAPAPAPCRRRCRGSCPPAVMARRVIVGEQRPRPRVDAPAGVQRLRQPEVEHLHRAVGAHLDVRRLQIAMDDPLLVRGFERLGDLLRDRQRLVERDGAARDALPPRSSPSTSSITSARTSVRLLEAVDVRDVRMIQRGEDFGFALEAREPIGIARRRSGAGP